MTILNTSISQDRIIFTLIHWDNIMKKYIAYSSWTKIESREISAFLEKQISFSIVHQHCGSLGVTWCHYMIKPL